LLIDKPFGVLSTRNQKALFADADPATTQAGKPWVQPSQPRENSINERGQITLAFYERDH
jgi:hypothetical protein